MSPSAEPAALIPARPAGAAAASESEARRFLRGRAAQPERPYRPLGTPDNTLQQPFDVVRKSGRRRRRRRRGGGGATTEALATGNEVSVGSAGAINVEDAEYERFFKTAAPTAKQRWMRLEDHHRCFDNGYSAIQAQLAEARGLPVGSVFVAYSCTLEIHVRTERFTQRTFHEKDRIITLTLLPRKKFAEMYTFIA